ncbi:MFS transporter [Lihuaxuella thermophila]|uniref:Predicted arabinose efflux permease, MFS family n=1 Tax=Lihuaxuella thermophila TaxID=1173111 RepID=A0A1H8DDI7_9BACL|nr:MFS transporter [Lihuaxuella thermophila]SEN05350.1 Predicted arabinose efflux permease, MFS family [Lihuaxuella thermophila]
MDYRIWKQNMVTLWTGQFVATAGLTVMVPLLPFYIADLAGTNDSFNHWWMGLCLAAPAITMFIFSPVWGRIGDHWGRKWMVVRALIGLAVSLLLMGFAQTPLQLFLCRLLQGAFGGVVDASAAFASSEAPQGKNGKILGNLHSATAAGSFIGPLLGGILADFCGYRTLFMVMAVLTGLCSCLAAWMLTERKGYASGVQSKGNPSIAAALVALFQNRETRAFILAGICAQSGIYGLTVIFAPYIQSLAGETPYTATWVGTLQAVTWLSTMVAAPWWGKQNDCKSVQINFFVAAFGCGISICLQVIPHAVGWLIPLRMIQGMCFAALLPSVYLQVSRCSGDRDRSTKIGLTNSCLTGGQMIGSLVGAGLTGWLPLPAVMICMGILFILGACLAVTRREVPFKEHNPFRVTSHTSE